MCLSASQHKHLHQQLNPTRCDGADTHPSPSPSSQRRGLHAPHLAGARTRELTRSPRRSRSESTETKTSRFWHAFRPGRWKAICLSLGIIISTPGMLLIAVAIADFSQERLTSVKPWHRNLPSSALQPSIKTDTLRTAKAPVRCSRKQSPAQPSPARSPVHHKLNPAALLLL